MEIYSRGKKGLLKKHRCADHYIQPMFEAVDKLIEDLEGDWLDEDEKTIYKISKIERDTLKIRYEGIGWLSAPEQRKLLELLIELDKKAVLYRWGIETKNVSK